MRPKTSRACRPRLNRPALIGLGQAKQVAGPADHKPTSPSALSKPTAACALLKKKKNSCSLGPVASFRIWLHARLPARRPLLARSLAACSPAAGRVARLLAGIRSLVRPPACQLLASHRSPAGRVASRACSPAAAPSVATRPVRLGALRACMWLTSGEPVLVQ